MNVENILAVADAIEQHTFALGFNMVAYFRHNGHDLSGHKCATTACIYGWAMTLMEGSVSRARNSNLRYNEVNEWLGLNDRDGENVRYANHYPGRMSDVPRDQAVRTLRHLAATGEVDWTV